MKKRFKLLALTLSLLLGSSMALAACGSSGDTAETSSTTNPYGANTIDPAPDGTPILTVTNGSVSTDYTLKELQEFSTKDISIFEPFVQEQQEFTVIPLSEIFSQNKVGESAEVGTVALNYYVYSNTAKNFTTHAGYVAIARQGKDIPYDQGGPIRIIFPDDSEWATNLEAWNWSIRNIKVK